MKISAFFLILALYNSFAFGAEGSLLTGADPNQSADVNTAANDKGLSPLRLAARHGRMDTVTHLIETGEMNADEADEYGWTPLKEAAEQGHINIVKYLVSKGADINQTDYAGRTVLFWAACGRNRDMVEYFIEQSVDVNKATTWGEIPLHAAAGSGNKDLVILLAAAGSNIYQTNVYGWTPLHKAVRKGDKHIVHFLIKKYELIKDERSPVNQLDKEGLTPLHTAARQGNYTVVKLLLITGNASINRLGSGNRTPLDWARINKRSEVEDLLVQQGAESDSVCRNVVVLKLSQDVPVLTEGGKLNLVQPEEF